MSRLQTARLRAQGRVRHSRAELLPPRTPRTHHVHLVSWSSDLWRDHLLFRDYLRAHPVIAREYETIKRELAAMYLQDQGAVYGCEGTVRPLDRAACARGRLHLEWVAMMADAATSEAHA